MCSISTQHRQGRFVLLGCMSKQLHVKRHTACSLYHALLRGIPSALYSSANLSISLSAVGACTGVCCCCLVCCCPSLAMLLPIACGELCCCGSSVKL